MSGQPQPSRGMSQGSNHGALAQGGTPSPGEDYRPDIVSDRPAKRRRSSSPPEADTPQAAAANSQRNHQAVSAPVVGGPATSGADVVHSDADVHGSGSQQDSNHGAQPMSPRTAERIIHQGVDAAQRELNVGSRVRRAKSRGVRAAVCASCGNPELPQWSHLREGDLTTLPGPGRRAAAQQLATRIMNLSAGSLGAAVRLVQDALQQTELHGLTQGLLHGLSLEQVAVHKVIVDGLRATLAARPGTKAKQRNQQRFLVSTAACAAVGAAAGASTAGDSGSSGGGRRSRSVGLWKIAEVRCGHTLCRHRLSRSLIAARAVVVSWVR